MKFKVLSCLIVNLCITFPVAALSDECKTALVNVLPRTVEYALISLANKKCLDLQDNPSTDPKILKKAHILFMLADMCRLADDSISLALSFRANNLQGYGFDVDEFIRKFSDRFISDDAIAEIKKNRLGNYGDDFGCENAFYYDFFWTTFDAIRIRYYINLVSTRLGETNKNSSEQPQCDVPSEEQIANKTKDKVSKLVRLLCIYVLPAIEVGCNAMNGYTFGASPFGDGCNASFADSALRAKIKALQSMSRLVSEMLLCEKGSKLRWVYVALLVVVAAKLCFDWNMEGRAFNETTLRTKEEWEQVKKKWDNIHGLYKLSGGEEFQQIMDSFENFSRASTEDLPKLLDGSEFRDLLIDQKGARKPDFESQIIKIENNIRTRHREGNFFVIPLINFGLRILGTSSEKNFEKAYRNLMRIKNTDKTGPLSSDMQFINNVRDFLKLLLIQNSVPLQNPGID